MNIDKTEAYRTSLVVKRTGLRAISLGLSLFCAFLATAQTKNSEPQLLSLQGDLSPIHDPTIIRQGGTYYVFSTNWFQRKLLPIFCSPDLQQWKFCGNVFDGVPEWALKEVPGGRGIWAPDISHVQGEYRLYYAVSTFGSRHSVIGLSTNKTLDVTDPEYKWVDKGMVVRSTNEDDFNAIDPTYVQDASGNGWLAFGSFWGGIKMRRLDETTGKLSERDTSLYSLASRRPLEPPAIEAPAIIRHDKHYYLFVSFGFCCRGKESTYKILVGRADKITGPYLDRNGKAMMQGGGTLLMESSSAWRGPGGQSVFRDASQYLMALHSYDAQTGRANLMISTIVWENGWPKAAVLP